MKFTPLLWMSACSVLSAPKLIDTGSRAGESFTPPSSSTSSTRTTPTTSGTKTTDTTSPTSSSPTGTKEDAWRCEDGPAVPVDLQPVLNTCPVKLSLDPTPWELVCGDPGQFQLRLGVTDLYPMTCEWEGWGFLCEGDYLSSFSLYEGIFDHRGVMRGTVSTDVFMGASSCHIEYLWELALG